MEFFRGLKMKNQTIPQEYEPSPSEVEKYIRLWNSLDNYVNQEKALDKLFFSLCQKNDTIEDVLLKCSTLNDFYSTNIFDIHAIAKHILSIADVDKRLKNGDLTLVDEIAHVEVGKEKKQHFFYSFASKYCSHHQPLMYAIYDNYVEKVLLYFKRRDKFYNFNNSDLRNYPVFINIIHKFQESYGLTAYNLKEIDKYLWQLGKSYYKKYN